MIVSVTGGTGFTGEYVVRELLTLGHDVRCLVRPTSDVSRLPAFVSRVVGTLEDTSAMRSLVGGAAAHVNISSLGFGHARNVIDACMAEAVQRVVVFSTTSIFTKLRTRSGQIRRQAEQQIQDSALAWTILRPTMIYGTERDRNMCRLIRFLSRTLVVPLPGGGKAAIQPVHVEDLAFAVRDVIANPRTERRIYNLPGRSPSRLHEIITFLLSTLQRRAFILKLPLGAMAAVAQIWQRTGLKPHITAEQVRRLAETKAFSYEDAGADFGYQPRTWQEGLLTELERLRRIGWIG